MIKRILIPVIFLILLTVVVTAQGDMGKEVLTAPAQLVLNDEQKIIGLWFGNWTLTEDNLDKIMAEFKDIDGTVSVSIVKNNQEEILAYNGDQKMAVGSTFKLYVLKNPGILDINCFRVFLLSRLQ